MGYAELILGRVDTADPVYRDVGGEILKAANRSAELTRQLLAFFPQTNHSSESSCGDET